MGSVNLELDGPSPCYLPVQGVTFYELAGVIRGSRSGRQFGIGNVFSESSA